MLLLVLVLSHLSFVRGDFFLIHHNFTFNPQYLNVSFKMNTEPDTRNISYQLELYNKFDTSTFIVSLEVLVPSNEHKKDYDKSLSKITFGMCSKDQASGNIMVKQFIAPFINCLPPKFFQCPFVKGQYNASCVYNGDICKKGDSCPGVPDWFKRILMKIKFSAKIGKRKRLIETFALQIYIGIDMTIERKKP